MENQLPEILIVDLDGTLLQTDMLLETFWSAWADDWLVPLKALKVIFKERTHLKAYLSSCAHIDVPTLPYNEEVLETVRLWRSEGKKTALITATHESLAKKIASHLGFFDEVHGTTDFVNLKGSKKADLIVDRYPNFSVTYMGDSHADLAVWQRVHKVVTVNANQSLRAEAESLGKDVEHVFTNLDSARSYVNALRPHQWLKNVLVFLPLLAAHNFQALRWYGALLAFVSLCLVASGVYVMNDLLDLHHDRNHPRKKTRPFASGQVPIQHGGFMIAALWASGIWVSVFTSSSLWKTLLIYLLLTTSYSLIWKRKAIVDIGVLSALYSLRILAGGISSGVEVSAWLLACSLFFFLSLAAVKRQAEIVDLHRRGLTNMSGRAYGVKDARMVSTIGIFAGLIAVLVLAVYGQSDAVTILYSSPQYLWGMCATVLFWLFRIFSATYRGVMHDDPILFAVQDRISWLCLCGVIGFGALAVVA